MADDIKIIVRVEGDKDIVKTTQSLKKMETGVRTLSKDLDAGRISENQFNTGLKELRRTVDSSFGSWQKAKGAVDVYAKSVQQAAQAAKQARIDQEVLKISASYDRLKSSIDPAFAAQQRMRKAHEDIRSALKAELITRTEAAQSLVEYRKQAKVFMQTQMAATKASNRFGVVTQQAGYQVGDFLVQVQSGTNPMVAFGQQATQLVGILPLMTGAFGLSTTALIGLSAGLGIAIPLATAIGAALLKSGESSNSASDGIKKYESAVKSLREETEKLNDEIEVQLRGMNSLNELYVQKEIERLESKRVDLMSQMETLSGRNLRAAQLRLNALEGEIEANKQILSDNEAARDKSEKIKNIWVEIKSTIEETSVGHLLTGFDQMYDKLIAMQETALRGAAVGRGRGLGRGGPTAEELIRNVPAVQLAYSNKDDSPIKTGSSSGGVVPKDPLEGQFKQLEKFLSTERELVNMEYENRQLTLEQSLEKGYLAKETYAEMELELERRKQAELGEIEEKTQKAKVSAIAGGIADVLSAAANGNEKILKMARVVGAAEALINTYRAAAQTLADPSLPFYAKFSAVAATVAAGLSMVSSIKSGSSSSASGSAATMPAQAAAPTPQRVIIEGIDRDSLFSGEQLSNIFEAIYEENENRGMVFEVAR